MAAYDVGLDVQITLELGVYVPDAELSADGFDNLEQLATRIRMACRRDPDSS